MARVEHEAVGDGGGAGDERQEGEEHVGIVDSPSAVARRMLLAREHDAVGAAGEDEGGTDDRGGNVEGDIRGEGGDHVDDGAGGPAAQGSISLSRMRAQWRFSIVSWRINTILEVEVEVTVGQR